jgi:hypothetical protein
VTERICDHNPVKQCLKAKSAVDGALCFWLRPILLGTTAYILYRLLNACNAGYRVGMRAEEFRRITTRILGGKDLHNVDHLIWIIAGIYWPGPCLDRASAGTAPDRTGSIGFIE